MRERRRVKLYPTLSIHPECTGVTPATQLRVGETSVSLVFVSAVVVKALNNL